MLVLTRKSEEKITIGKNIVVTVLKIQGDKVSLGISAPTDVQIIRNELLEKQSQETQRHQGGHEEVHDAGEFNVKLDERENVTQDADAGKYAAATRN